MPRVESHYGAFILYGRDYGLKDGTLIQVEFLSDIAW